MADASPKKPKRNSKSAKAKPAAKRKGPAAAQPKLTRKRRAGKIQPPVSAIGLVLEAPQPDAITWAVMDLAVVESDEEKLPIQAIEILTEPAPEPEPALESLGQIVAPLAADEIAAANEVSPFIEDAPNDEPMFELQSLAADECVVTVTPLKPIEHAEPVAAPKPEPFTYPELSSASAPAAALRLERLPPAPRPIEYLDRARRAAQAQSEGLRQNKGLLSGLGNHKGLFFSIGASAMVLLIAGLFVAGRDKLPGGAEGVSPTMTEANAATGGAAPRARAEEAYDEARRLIAEGRTAQGLGLLEQAAADGLVAAQYDLSKRYDSGDGLPRNLTLARSWAERAARGGDVRAMHDTGVYYARGEGAPRDEAAAFRWFREAAMHGVADSQYNLGVMYERGRGVAGEPEEALFWFLVAARNEEADAIDRAVTLASTLSPDVVARIQTRARAFESRHSPVVGSAP